MKVMLMNHPITISAEEWVGGNAMPPLGILYIASYVEKERPDIELKILDCLLEAHETPGEGGRMKRVGLTGERIREEITSFAPDLVGISSMYTSYSADAHWLAGLVKEVNRDITVVLGGTHPSSNPERVLKDRNVDVVVKGEGERTFIELLDAVASRAKVACIPGTYSRDGDEVAVAPERGVLIENLDELPFPARHLLPMKSYFGNWASAITYNMRLPVTTLISSRGCPGKCIYCAVQNLYGRRWRARSPTNVVDEIETLMETYGVREVSFSDDSMSVNRKRMQALCNEILRRGIDVKWAPPTGIAIWTLDEELLDLMKRSGCYRLTFGLESGNAQTLKYLGKDYSYEHATRIIKHANNIGIWTAGTFIIGFPDETRESVADTIDFAVKSALDFAVFYTPVVFPGTRLFDEFRLLGLEVLEDIDGVLRSYNTRHFTGEELNRIRGEVNRRLLVSRMKRPLQIIKKVRSLEDLVYLFKIFRNFARLVKVGHGKSATAFIRQTKSLARGHQT